MAANRVQRWVVFLAGYGFKIKHIKDNRSTDSLYRELVGRILTSQLS